jgi:hypothetical protein
MKILVLALLFFAVGLAAFGQQEFPDGKFLDRDLHGKELGEKLEALLH